MIRQYLKIITRLAILELINNDDDLLKNSVREEVLSHRLAHYIENLYSLFMRVDRLHVDCEYDKHDDVEKTLPDLLAKYPDKKTDIVRPDIIFHRRGSDQSNLLIIELKKSTGSGKEYAKDKIEMFVNSPYGYKLGVYVEFFVGQEYKKRCELGEQTYLVKFFETKKEKN